MRSGERELALDLSFRNTSRIAISGIVSGPFCESPAASGSECAIQRHDKAAAATSSRSRSRHSKQSSERQSNSAYFRHRSASTVSDLFRWRKTAPSVAAFSADWNEPCSLLEARTSAFCKKNENCTGNGAPWHRLDRRGGLWSANFAELRKLTWPGRFCA